MRRRDLLQALTALSPGAAMTDAAADMPAAQLAAYYDRHAACVGGVMWGWEGAGPPRRLLAGCRQAGVSEDAWFALRDDGRLQAWVGDAASAVVLMRGVARFAAGQSGWFAIDQTGVLWQGKGRATTPRRVATDVADASIGDSADYYVTADGRLFVHGLAHRGQYGDGLLRATDGYVSTATDVAQVRAHTGHAIHRRRDGTVMGTGGNGFGPLSAHGLGDKADRWGPIIGGAVAIATGSRHSLAIRDDRRLWAWGEGFTIAPAPVMNDVEAVAAGMTVTLA